MANTQLDAKGLEDKFYSQPFSFSYSGLSKLLYSPRLFYNHYILQEREESLGQHLVEGKAIHCLLLDNGSFDNQFIVSLSNLPSTSTKTVIDKLFYEKKIVAGELKDHEQIILEILREINLHQSLKTDQQRTDKILNDEAKSYWIFLNQKGTKDLLDQETLDRCKQSVETLKKDKYINELMGLTPSDFELQEIFNEQLIEISLKNKPFGLKGVLDNIVLDYTNKTVFVNDLKTSGKTLSEFRESIQYYNYNLQSAIYSILVSYKFKELFDQGWKLQFSFVVIDKYQQVGIIEISDATLLEWCSDLETVFAKATIHYESRDYSKPSEFIAQGKVII
tara:strand:- start:1213 stop:2217 length:1005 start_codon:yes stop_codon:yes gene_type:complete